jgi:hypothetical protein
LSHARPICLPKRAEVPGRDPGPFCLLSPCCVIVGTWTARANWEAWHHDPQFTETRQRLDGLESAPAEHWWHDVVLDVREDSTPPPPTAKSPSKRRAKGKTKSPRRSSA